MTNPLDEDAVPLILDEPKHGKGRGISMTTPPHTLFMSEPVS